MLLTASFSPIKSILTSSFLFVLSSTVYPIRIFFSPLIPLLPLFLLNSYVHLLSLPILDSAVYLLVLLHACTNLEARFESLLLTIWTDLRTFGTMEGFSKLQICQNFAKPVDKITRVSTNNNYTSE